MKTMIKDQLYDHGYDHDLCHDYDNGCELNHLQDVDMNKGFDRDDGYVDDDENDDDNGDGHIDLEGLFGSYKENFGSISQI